MLHEPSQGFQTAMYCVVRAVNRTDTSNQLGLFYDDAKVETHEESGLGLLGSDIFAVW